MKVLRNFMLVVMVALGVGLCFNPTANVKAASGVGTVKNVKKSKVKYVQSKKINGKKCFGNYRTISWKKVKGAKSYQVKVGNKKYNAKKTNVKIKKLAVGKTYKVQVRAKNAAGFGKWSKAVKVTIKK